MAETVGIYVIASSTFIADIVHYFYSPTITEMK